MSLIRSARVGHQPTARRVLTAVTAAIVLSVVQLTAVVGQSPSPEASPVPFPATAGAPDSEPMGASYGTWAERWWTWLLSFPADQDASLATACPASPADGPVFLPQTYFGTLQQLTCTISADQSLLVSAGGSLCTADPGDTDADILACLEENDATIFNPSIAIDGRLLPDIEQYHAYTDPFDLTLPDENAFGEPVVGLRSAASAWVAILSDFAPGTYTIVLRDETTEPTLGTQVAESIVTLTVTE